MNFNSGAILNEEDFFFAFLFSKINSFRMRFSIGGSAFPSRLNGLLVVGFDSTTYL